MGELAQEHGQVDSSVESIADRVLSESDSSPESSSSEQPHESSYESQESESQEAEPQESESQENQEEPDYSSLLEGVNKLGLENNGEALKFDDVDGLKSMLEKGYQTDDMTKQVESIKEEVAKERESFTQEVQEFEKQRQELSDMQFEYDTFYGVLEDLKQSDPDVFEEIMTAFNTRANNQIAAQNNPVFQGQQQKIDALEQQLKQISESQVQREDAEILSQRDRELKDTQSKYGPQLKDLGIVPKWKEVEKFWAKGMTYEQALHAVHGTQIAKVSTAKAKVHKTKQASEQRLGQKLEGAPQGNAQRSTVKKGADYLNKIVNRALGDF